ncbi:MAG TPA: DinB family protein [Longimicrobiaceae bacterium]|nr:DinB family protein [Longimicrobiaceae bacterium]
MTESERILDELRRAWDGDPWHGSPVREVLAGVTAAEAAARPLPRAHSIWELVLHLTAWTREVTRRVRTGVSREPEEGDWPPVGDTGEAAWRAALAALEEANQELFAAVAGLRDGQVDEVLGEARDRPLGSGVPYGVMLHGLAQHHAYHAGQIALLRKGLG